ncbi:MAG TPA: MBL fold metallo-hydrolase [Flexilinea sp.]|jgi:glyoxylase-like metal-dependent hydrolase (beta-lactamase superfamily II)|nr:MBL fold metallo-hydrolase [Flexilinea sp.]HOP02027.1 MBL fold metallo-hydrolase [Flexilinea sp.]HOR55918.1 MBL fold metallo-hydrolase [Flexilinea sp.]HOU19195.1 MBL fold metallo-hydrolase [Flexilinea sp.]HPJ64673.1 MBL fold metallo-hydrolase [Flexilinea sp.]
MNNPSYQYEDLTMIPFQSGPLLNNTYLIADRKSKECIAIDPSFFFEQVLEKIDREQWNFKAIWLTHAHFDHIAGIRSAVKSYPQIPIAMHPDDEIIRENGGIASNSSAGQEKYCPKPAIHLRDGMTLAVGKYEFQVLHTPGHAPGHCCFYQKEAGWLFTGDLIFYHDCGRTDLLGGNPAALMNSIREKILTLPDETLIFPGHEEFSSVGAEKPYYK